MDIKYNDLEMVPLRACVMWILSKAFKNHVPEYLIDPFYLDNDNHECLKPQIIVELANGTLYCQTLYNMYLDQSFQSLNHTSILQILARKGIPIYETTNSQVTETMLIQTNPLKINAHLTVIKSLMNLFIKEVTPIDRITNAIKRISDINVKLQNGYTIEICLLLWISHVCITMKNKIQNEIKKEIDVFDNRRFKSFKNTSIEDLQDGIFLALLISFYYPKMLPWTSVRLGSALSFEDSLHNLNLVVNFAYQHLPYNVCYITAKDIYSMRTEIKLNLIVFLSELFHLLETNRTKSFIHPKTEFQEFLVQQSTGVKTLPTSPHDALIPARLRFHKENTYTERKNDERGENNAAGRPSNWNRNKRQTYAGRRSRKNSVTEDSQLTLENFGGSHDELHSAEPFSVNREENIVSVSCFVHPPINSFNETLMLKFNADSDTEKQDQDSEKSFSQKLRSMENRSHLNPFDCKNCSKLARNADLFQNYIKSNLTNIQDKLEEKRELMENEKLKYELGLRRKPETKSIKRLDACLYDLQKDIKKLREQKFQIESQYSQGQPILDLRSTLKEQTPLNLEGEGYIEGILSYPDLSPHFYNISSLRETDEYTDMITDHKKSSRNLFTQEEFSKKWLKTNQSKLNLTSENPILMKNPSSQTMNEDILIDSMNDACYSNLLNKQINSCFIKDDIHKTADEFNLSQIDNTKDLHELTDKCGQLEISASYIPEENQQEKGSIYVTSVNSSSSVTKRALQTTYKKTSTLLENNHRLSKQNTIDSLENNEDLKEKSIGALNLNMSCQKIDDMTPQSICFIGDQEDPFYFNQYASESRLESLSSESLKKRCSETEYQKSNHVELFPLEMSSNACLLNCRNLSSSRGSPYCEEVLSMGENQKRFYVPFENDLPKFSKPICATRSVITMEEKKKLKPTNQAMELKLLSTISSSTSNHEPISESLFTDEKKNVPSIELADPQICSEENDNKFSKQQDIFHAKSIISKNFQCTEQKSNGVSAMERKKEKILLLSLLRRQQLDEAKTKKESEIFHKQERNRQKELQRIEKQEKQSSKRAAILSQYRLKKALQQAEHEGKSHVELSKISNNLNGTTVRLKQTSFRKPRPKTMHIEDTFMVTETAVGNSLTLSEKKNEKSHWTPPISENRSTPRFHRQKANSLINLSDIDSGIGRSTPPRRAASPSMATTIKYISSQSGHESLPTGLVVKRNEGNSLIEASNFSSSFIEYTGPRLFKQPASKSNRGIILNAVEYCVFPGTVNRQAKIKVLEKISQSESKHFLVLFRDAGCQFRAFYSYIPDSRQIKKLYGTGPNQVDEEMFDKFYKYNSSSKCFTEVYTKHLTATIDAFTILNSLWQGKKMIQKSSNKLGL